VVQWLKDAGYTETGFRERVNVPEDSFTHRYRSVDNGFVALGEALDELERALPEGRSITVDGGRFTSEAVQRLSVPGARSWSFSGRGFGAVGNGLSTAIGIGAALGDEPSVAVVGDGGFMLGGLAEFNTAVRYGIDLIVVVCNDGSYGAEYRKLRSRDFATDVSMFEWPDFAPIADSLGGIGFTVRNHDDLDSLEAVIEQRDRPLLIDLKLDPAAGSLEH
jgi:thiamine pyrophosphate-dependent acetolactate synthase large subunit-like protein